MRQRTEKSLYNNMNKTTKQKIDNIVNAIAMTDIKMSRALRALITSIYIDGELAGLDKAKEIYSDLSK